MIVSLALKCPTPGDPLPTSPPHSGPELVEPVNPHTFSPNNEENHSFIMHMSLLEAAEKKIYQIKVISAVQAPWMSRGTVFVSRWSAQYARNMTSPRRSGESLPHGASPPCMRKYVYTLHSPNFGVLVFWCFWTGEI